MHMWSSKLPCVITAFDKRLETTLGNCSLYMKEDEFLFTCFVVLEERYLLQCFQAYGKMIGASWPPALLHKPIFNSALTFIFGQYLEILLHNL